MILPKALRLVCILSSLWQHCIYMLTNKEMLEGTRGIEVPLLEELLTH